MSLSLILSGPKAGLTPFLPFFASISFGVRSHALSSSGVLFAPALTSGFLASVWQPLQAGLALSNTALPAAASPAAPAGAGAARNATAREETAITESGRERILLPRS
jgi:hypothetical protein